MNLSNTLRESWFQNLPQPQQRLIRLSLELLAREKRLQSRWHDYSFILFPMSKAYEGFLKLFFYQSGLISEKTFKGRRFRIGRSLNPDISDRHKDEWWLYDDVARQCGDELARELWNAWIQCRNHVFHYFPNRKIDYTLPEIERRIQLLLSLMKKAEKCEVKS